MSEAVTIDRAPGERASSGLVQRVKDVLELAKPRITVLEVTMMFGGMALAPGALDMWTTIGAAIGTALIVAGANAFNMYLERDIDRDMARTRHRPLPSGRMVPGVALAVALILASAALVTLYATVNWLTALLGFVGFASYVFVYTPLKRYTDLALAIGAVPGAVPALMGWTAVTGEIGAIGLVYAGILFFWQIPHFLGIAMYRREEYAKANLVVTPNVASPAAIKLKVILYTVALVSVSIALVPVGGAGILYLVVAAVLGAWFLALVVTGTVRDDMAAAGRRIFVASLVYLPVLALGLVADAVI